MCFFVFFHMWHPKQNCRANPHTFEAEALLFYFIFHLSSTDESKKQIKSWVSWTSNTGETPPLFLYSSELIVMEPFIPKWILKQNQTLFEWQKAYHEPCIKFLFLLFSFWVISKQMLVRIGTLKGQMTVASIMYFSDTTLYLYKNQQMWQSVFQSTNKTNC